MLTQRYCLFRHLVRMSRDRKVVHCVNQRRPRWMVESQVCPLGGVGFLLKQHV